MDVVLHIHRLVGEMGDLKVWRAKGIQAGFTVFHRSDTGAVSNRQSLEHIGRCA